MVPCGMGGILATPSWLVRVSHVFRIFLPSFILARPFTNLTMTLARSTGRSFKDLTSTVSVVMLEAARRVAAMAMRPAGRRRRIRIFPIIPKIGAGSGNVGQQELAGLPRGSGNSLGSAVAAAHSALHGCGPARARPVSSQEHI